MGELSSQAHDLSRSLAGATAIIRSFGQEYQSTAVRMDELTNRLAAGRFHLAVLGQFKRGKSTLLNALLGQPVLPASVDATKGAIRAGIAKRKDQSERVAYDLAALESGMSELNIIDKQLDTAHQQKS